MKERDFIRRFIDEVDDHYDVDTEFGEGGPFNVPSLPSWILALREEAEDVLAEVVTRTDKGAV